MAEANPAGDRRSQSRRHILRGANDSGRAGEACVTDAGAALAYPSITPAELEILGPLIKALAQMAANDLSATTFSSEET